MVVDYIVSGLKKYTENINIQDRESIRAGNLWHLKTSISAQIEPEQLKAVILDLHPYFRGLWFTKRQSQKLYS